MNNCIVCDGCFMGNEIEDGVFHGGELEGGTFHGGELEGGTFHHFCPESIELEDDKDAKSVDGEHDSCSDDTFEFNS